MFQLGQVCLFFNLCFISNFKMLFLLFTVKIFEMLEFHME